MINLQEISSLPITFDDRDNALFVGENASCDQISRIKLSEMIPILLNRTLVYPDKVYNEYLDVKYIDDEKVFKSKGLHYNVLVMPTGLLGVEYTKSHIYTTDKAKTDIIGVIEVLYGAGTLIMQKLAPKDEFDFDTSVESVVIVKVPKGARVPIPAGYQYAFINTRSKPLVIAKLTKNDGRLDYRTMRKEQGLSYYAIRKNARQEYVKNPRYRDIPKLKKEKPEVLCKKYNLTSSKPLYDQVVQNPDRFSKLLS